LMKGGAFSLDPRDKDAPVDFAFDHAWPGLGIGFGFEGLRWAGKPMWRICGNNDFQDQDRFLSEALTPVTQGKEDGALGGIRTHDPCLRSSKSRRLESVC
jgi:hypothetical protein